MPELTLKKIVSILKKVPEKHFRIMDLAPQLVDDKGNVDIVKAIDLQGEVNLALIEIQSYIKATRETRKALEWIGGYKINGDEYVETEWNDEEPEDIE